MVSVYYYRHFVVKIHTATSAHITSSIRNIVLSIVNFAIVYCFVLKREFISVDKTYL